MQWVCATNELIVCVIDALWKAIPCITACCAQSLSIEKQVLCPFLFYSSFIPPKVAFSLFLSLSFSLALALWAETTCSFTQTKEKRERESFWVLGFGFGRTAVQKMLLTLAKWNKPFISCTNFFNRRTCQHLVHKKSVGSCSRVSSSLLFLSPALAPVLPFFSAGNLYYYCCCSHNNTTFIRTQTLLLLLTTRAPDPSRGARDRQRKESWKLLVSPLFFRVRWDSRSADRRDEGRGGYFFSAPSLDHCCFFSRGFFA